MIVLDDVTAQVLTGTIVSLVAVAYIVTSLQARDTGGARLWALAYLLGLTAIVFSYVGSVATASSWVHAWALGLCHAAMVGVVGVLLLGCRAFSGMRVDGPAFLMTGVALMTGAATFADAVSGAQLMGDLWLLASLAGLCFGVVYHAVTGRLRSNPASWILAAGALIGGGYSVLGAVAIIADGSAMAGWYSPATSAMVIAAVTVLWAVSTFVLRAVLTAGDAARGDEDSGILSASAFQLTLRALLRRSTERLELIAVIAVSIDDVSAVTVAFGRASAERSTAALRLGVRRFAAPTALVGESGQSTTMLVATLAATAADARRQAGLLYRGIVRDFVEARDIAMPGVGIGVALSQALGYDAELLVAGALAAAEEASASEETSVVFARVRDLPVDPFPAEPA